MNTPPTNFSQLIGAEVERMVDIYFDRTDGRRPQLYELIMSMAEKPLIEAVLLRHGGNQKRTALTLGINRNTLRKKMAEHGIGAAR